ncbi:amidase [Pigmentiphaga soli]|uniref:Amidase n=1 Tax=Pigmentiphaga soli TaxID=1007095 RepID=A0ABP8HAV2_9BURK
MPQTPPNALTATEAAAAIREGRLSSTDLVEACLARIDEREPALRAWAHLDPELGREQARQRDADTPAGPLHGVPIAVKDVIDTADQPTQMGSPIYAGYRPAADASIVSLLRGAGAVILGKTATAEFAGTAPAATTNPHDPTRTPGGSSSGSAAAVADLMVPVALGTQTGGSVQRPASFCGVFGYKPSYGRINRAGLKFAAESLDTLGWMARSLDDLALLDAVLSGEAPAPLEPLENPRIGICRTYLWERAEPSTRQALHDAADALRQAGLQVTERELPADFAGLSPVREVLNDYERARAMAYEWSHHRARISPQLSRSIERGFAMRHADYLQAQRFAHDTRVAFDAWLDDCDVLVAPCVNGEAPKGLDHTGDTTFQSLWTLLHAPTVGLPTHRGPHGLPVSIQLVARRGDDARLLRAALAAWRILSPQNQPGCRSAA